MKTFACLQQSRDHIREPAMSTCAWVDNQAMLVIDQLIEIFFGALIMELQERADPKFLDFTGFRNAIVLVNWNAIKDCRATPRPFNNEIVE